MAPDAPLLAFIGRLDFQKASEVVGLPGFGALGLNLEPSPPFWCMRDPCMQALQALR